VAKLLGVAQPRVSDVMRGRIDLFSIDTLINMLARLGICAKLVLHPRRRRAGVAQQRPWLVGNDAQQFAIT